MPVPAVPRTELSADPGPRPGSGDTESCLATSRVERSPKRGGEGAALKPCRVNPETRIPLSVQNENPKLRGGLSLEREAKCGAVPWVAEKPDADLLGSHRDFQAAVQAMVASTKTSTQRERSRCGVEHGAGTAKRVEHDVAGSDLRLIRHLSAPRSGGQVEVAQSAKIAH